MAGRVSAMQGGVDAGSWKLAIVVLEWEVFVVLTDFGSAVLFG